MTMAIVRPTPPVKANSAPSLTASVPSTPVSTVAAVYGRQRPTPPALPKEVVTNGTPQEPKAEESRPAPKPIVPSGQSTNSGQLEEGTGGEGEDDSFSGQLTIYQLPKLNLVDKHKLWRKLNEGAPSYLFITVLRPDNYPKRVVREDPANDKPAGKGVMWCCYCGDWTVFEHFAYIGSNKCICCSISTKDFHNRTANKLWNKEDL